MAYRFRTDETINENVRRVVTAEIRKSLDELQNTEITRNDAVHQARKRLKRIRGVLRLVREGMGDSYQFENCWYRDVARTLSSTREADALLEMYKRHIHEYRSKLALIPSCTLRTVFLPNPDTIITPIATDDALIAHTIRNLQLAQERVTTWTIEQHGFASIRQGLKKVYGLGRKRMAAAYGSPTVETFHEWRKQVKYHWYHIKLLGFVWPQAMAARATLLRGLAEILGDEHDLSMLAARVQNHEERGPNISLQASDKIVFFRTLQAHKKSLRIQAYRLGTMAYAESPSSFTKRMGAYWNVAHRSQD